MFFAGPSGVGKTYLAKKLAEFLFGSEEAFIRFDMSEFKEEHTVSKLLGSPPGYVGFEQGGILTNSVRARPFSVVLFDEVEKAHPKILDVFLQILDDGRLSDSQGQTVYFTETLLVFTSNIGTRTTDCRGRAIDERQRLDEILADEQLTAAACKAKVREHFIAAVQSFFIHEISRPELLNRLGNNILPFNYIQAPEIQAKIVRSHFERVTKDFADRYAAAGHQLEFDPQLVDWLVTQRGSRFATFARGKSHMRLRSCWYRCPMKCF